MGNAGEQPRHSGTRPGGQRREGFFPNVFWGSSSACDLRCVPQTFAASRASPIAEDSSNSKAKNPSRRCLSAYFPHLSRSFSRNLLAFRKSVSGHSLTLGCAGVEAVPADTSIWCYRAAGLPRRPCVAPLPGQPTTNARGRVVLLLSCTPPFLVRRGRRLT